MSKPRRAAKRLSAIEANRRLVSIVSILEHDIQAAVEMKAVLQSWSAEVEKQSAGERRFRNAAMINLAGNAIALQLAITLARIFDRGNKWRHDNQKNIASIPLAFRFLRQQRCKKYLINRRHEWFDDAPSLAVRFPASCKEAISRAMDAYHGWAAKKPHAPALHRLLQHRNSSLAHNLFDSDRSYRPYYGDLYALTDWASTILVDVLYAVTSARHNYAVREDVWKSQARSLYRAAATRRG